MTEYYDDYPSEEELCAYREKGFALFSIECGVTITESSGRCSMDVDAFYAVAGAGDVIEGGSQSMFIVVEVKSDSVKVKSRCDFKSGDLPQKFDFDAYDWKYRTETLTVGEFIEYNYNVIQSGVRDMSRVRLEMAAVL